MCLGGSALNDPNGAKWANEHLDRTGGSYLSSSGRSEIVRSVGAAPAGSGWQQSKADSTIYQRDLAYREVDKSNALNTQRRNMAHVEAAAASVREDARADTGSSTRSSRRNTTSRGRLRIDPTRSSIGGGSGLNIPR